MPTLPIVAAAKRTHLHFVVWHDIVPDGAKQVWFDTEITTFTAQLDALESAGAGIVSLDAAYNYLCTGRDLSATRPVVLCFDDNTAGIHRFAFPELSRRGYPFVVSAHTKYVGVTTGKAHNTWARLREMEASGLARVASQTHTHPPDLRTLATDALRREMWESKIRHEENMARAARFVTYPSGKWNTRVALAAAEAGYRLGLTEDHGAAELSPHRLAVRRWSSHKRFAEAVRAIGR